MELKVKGVNDLRPPIRGHLKLEFEEFLASARKWADQSSFSSSSALTQQAYFKSILEIKVWNQMN